MFLVAIFVVYHVIHLWKVSEGWPSVTATIVESSFTTQIDSGRMGSYSTVNGSLTFSYTVAGHSYRVQRLVGASLSLFPIPPSSPYQTEYAKGQHVIIHYCPTDPEKIAF